MKFNQADLEQGKLSTGNRPVPTVPYKAPEVNLVSPPSSPKFPVPEVIAYVKKFDFRIVPTISEAMTLRAQGLRVMTAREADIAYRSKIQLDNTCFLASILFGIITEGHPMKGETVYTLRAFYNRGVAYKKDGRYAKATPDEQARADQKMAEILAKLAEMQLPAHAEELINGFDVELTKPEFMTFDQYNRAAQAEYAPQ